MKAKNSFYLLPLLFCLTSCYDSGIESKEGPVSPTEEQGSLIEFYLSQADNDVTINRNTGSKSSKGDNVITNITFYLVEAKNTKTDTSIEAAFVIKDIVEGYEFEQKGNSVKVKGYTKLESGIYYVIAFANSKELNLNKKVNDTIREHDYISFNKDFINKATSLNSFFMTNSGKSFIYPNFPLPEDVYINSKSFFIQFLISNQNIETATHSVINLDQKRDDKNPAIAHVYLDRFVAAIDAKSENSINTVRPYIDIVNNDLSFALDGFVTLNSPLTQNLIEINQFYTDGIEGGSIVLGDFLSTPYALNFQENIKDMGWYNQIDTYSKIDTNNQVIDYKDASVKNKFNLKRKYVPENNTSTTKPPINDTSTTNCRQGYVTGVIFKVKEINNHSFYVIQNGLQNKLYKYNKNDADEVSQIPSNAIKYEEGVMYYTYFIPDLYQYAKGQLYDVDLFYSVMRNTIYTLHLNSLSTLGGIYPGGDLPNPGNPDEEIDKDNLIKLGIKILVNPWIDGKTDIEL